jgi:hypothetical protein
MQWRLETGHLRIASHHAVTEYVPDAIGMPDVTRYERGGLFPLSIR